MRLMNQRYIILEDIMWTPHLVSFLSFLFQHIFSYSLKLFLFSSNLQHILSTWCVIISFVSSNGIHIYYTSPITLKHELCTCGTLKDMKKQHRALKSQTLKGVSPHKCDVKYDNTKCNEVIVGTKNSSCTKILFIDYLTYKHEFTYLIYLNTAVFRILFILFILVRYLTHQNFKICHHYFIKSHNIISSL